MACVLPADMDDGETFIFMQAMEVNSSITVLDFSNNVSASLVSDLTLDTA